MTIDAQINSGDVVADMSNGGAFVSRATDPVVSNVATPGDFAAQFPTPLDPTEILTLCEEVALLQAIPEQRTGLQQVIWREMNALAFTSGSAYIAFADGVCPEEYSHSGNNSTLNLKNLGAKKSLTISDIMHSAAVIAGGSGIEALLGGYAAGQGLPGGNDVATFGRQAIRDLKEKEVRLGRPLGRIAEDRPLPVGNVDTRPVEFDGIEGWVTSGNGAQSATSSGTFSAQGFDRFLSESCAK